MSNVINIIGPLPNRKGSTNVDSLPGMHDETLEYMVFFDDPYATSIEAENAELWGGTDTHPILLAAIPPLWSYFIGFPQFICVRREPAMETNDPKIWKVSCTFSLPKNENKEKKPDGTAADSHKKWNIKVNGKSTPVSRAVNYTYDKKPIATAPGDLYKGVTTTDYDEEIVINYSTPLPDWDTWDTCRGAANDADITINVITWTVDTLGVTSKSSKTRTFKANTLKLDETSWDYMYDSSGVVQDFNCALRFLYRRSKIVGGQELGLWATHLVHEGTRCFNPSGKVVQCVTTMDGSGTIECVQEPVLLNSNGTQTTLPYDGSTTVNYRSFQIVPLTSFTTLLADIIHT